MASSERTQPTPPSKQCAYSCLQWTFKWQIVSNLWFPFYQEISLKIPWNHNHAVDIVQCQLMDATLCCLSLFLVHLLFLLPTGSSLLLHLLILISVMLNLISMTWFKEPGAIAMSMFTFSFSWHSLLSYCFDNENLSLIFLLFSNDSFIFMFVAISFLRLST